MSSSVRLGRQLDPEQIAKLMETPGGRIRFLRHTKNMTQATLAHNVNTSQPAVSQWEKNDWLPDVDRQIDIAAALGSTREFIFGDQVRVHRLLGGVAA